MWLQHRISSTHIVKQGTGTCQRYGDTSHSS